MLRPDRAVGIADPSAPDTYVVSPAFTIMVGRNSQFSGAELLSRSVEAWRQSACKTFANLEIHEESRQTHGPIEADVSRITFDKVGSRFECVTIRRVLGERIMYVDVSGQREAVRDCWDEYLSVLANSRLIGDQSEWGPEPASPSQVCRDALPEANEVGVLFDIAECDRTGNYADVARDEFLKALDLSKVSPGVVSCGDILDESKYFCVAVVTTREGIQHIRQVFGNGTRARGLAPLPVRFMSGRPLNAQSLSTRARIEGGICDW